MSPILTLIAVPVAILLLAALAQEWRYHRKRRDIVMDKQPLFHSAKALHVITALKLGPDQALLPGVRAFVDGLEAAGALVVYAGKSVITGTQSSQLPAVEWDAFVVTQFASRESWDEVAASDAYAELQAGFGNTWSIGMQRNRVQNLLLPVALLAMRARQIITGEEARFPFVPSEDPKVLEARDGVDPAQRRMFLEHVVRENAQYSENAMVIVNFQKDGSASQKKADAGYNHEMVSLMAEVGHGPVHIGDAVSLEGDADFDRVVLVYYPGVKYFTDMVQSKFYTGIFGEKQLGDTLSTPTVPILQHL